MHYSEALHQCASRINENPARLEVATKNRVKVSRSIFLQRMLQTEDKHCENKTFLSKIFYHMPRYPLKLARAFGKSFRTDFE